MADGNPGLAVRAEGSPRPTATVLVTAPGVEARTVPIGDRLFVGRTCAGIPEAHRVLVNGTGISRDHCQLQVDPITGQVALVDTSTNGTRLNSSLVERSVAIPLRDGDVIGLGEVTLLFRTSAAHSAGSASDGTVRLIAEGDVCVVCGDLVDYTTLTQLNGGPAVFTAMHALFDRLRVLLQEHRGTLYDYVGDAFLAMWEADALPDAARRGAEFAVAAEREVAAVAPGLALRGPDGAELRMGWAVTYGPVAMSSYAGSLTGLLGDVVNVGFRLASTAGRAGRAGVLVTGEAVAAGAAPAGLGPGEEVMVKGHLTPVTVHEVGGGVG